tara:strand:- start:229 stop:573 length:345 start_codon:yes stop_codon:yes gene_type:complete
MNCQECGRTTNSRVTPEGFMARYCETCSVNIEFMFHNNFRKMIPDSLIDDFKSNGMSASTNNNKEITDWQITDIIQFIDEHTEIDADFYREFTHLVFSHFGWTCYPTSKGAVNG